MPPRLRADPHSCFGPAGADGPFKSAPTNTGPRMLTLIHYPLCPHSRAIRSLLWELRLEVRLSEERHWEYRPEFLAKNPAGRLPILEFGTGDVLCGVYAISEYLADALRNDEPTAALTGLFPGDPMQRAEVRRLVDWFEGKAAHEVTSPLLREKVHKRFGTGAASTPRPEVVRAARANLRYTLAYMDMLVKDQDWLAGDVMSFADLAAAAHLSCADYLNEVVWDDVGPVRLWYARMKSRPSVRDYLHDRVSGIVTPPSHYDDPDF